MWKRKVSWSSGNGRNVYDDDGIGSSWNGSGNKKSRYITHWLQQISVWTSVSVCLLARSCIVEIYEIWMHSMPCVCVCRTRTQQRATTKTVFWEKKILAHLWSITYWKTAFHSCIVNFFQPFHVFSFVLRKKSHSHSAYNGLQMRIINLQRKKNIYFWEWQFNCNAIKLHDDHSFVLCVQLGFSNVCHGFFYGITLHILNGSTRFVRASIKWCIHIHTYTHCSSKPMLK